MTDMRRITVSLPDELDQKVTELQKEEKYKRFSYSKMVRMILMEGLAAMQRSA